MDSAIIVIAKEDIPLALNLQAQLTNVPIWVFDPHHLDLLVAQGCRNIRLIECGSSVDPVESAEVARKRTLEIESEVEQVLRNQFPEAVDNHWQYMNLYLQMAIIHAFSALWDQLLAQFPDVTMHVFVKDVHARYAAPSYWPALLLLERLNARRMPFYASNYDYDGDTSQFVPVAAGFLSDRRHWQALVHVPTCVYDAYYFDAEIRARFQDALQFPCMNHLPLVWSVQLPSLPAAGLSTAESALQALPPAQQLAIRETGVALEKCLTDVFFKFAKTERYVVRQVQYLAKQYQAQLVFLAFLQVRFQQDRPESIILSNHDAGLHGPFQTFASMYGIPLTMLPHAKVCNFPLSCNPENVQALVHPMQGMAATTVHGLGVHQRTLLFPEHLVKPYAPVRAFTVLGVILNEISAGGYMLVSPKEYLNGLKKIVDWCQDNGVQIKFRVRPNASCFHWLATNLEIDRLELESNAGGRLLDFAQTCDFTLMYDCPTTGVIELLQNASPVVNTVYRPLNRWEIGMVSPIIVPRESVGETLLRLSKFKDKAGELQMFRNQQFSDYAFAARDAAPLRELL